MIRVCPFLTNLRWKNILKEKPGRTTVKRHKSLDKYYGRSVCNLNWACSIPQIKTTKAKYPKRGKNCKASAIKWLEAIEKNNRQNEKLRKTKRKNPPRQYLAERIRGNRRNNSRMSGGYSGRGRRRHVLTTSRRASTNLTFPLSLPMQHNTIRLASSAPPITSPASNINYPIQSNPITSQLRAISIYFTKTLAKSPISPIPLKP